MSDDHNQSRQSQPGNESSWDSEQPPIEDEGFEKDGSAPTDMRKSHEKADALNKEIDTGSLLRRITGSLYHVTGSLEGVRSEEGPGLELPARSLQENSENGMLDDLRVSLSDLTGASSQTASAMPEAPQDDIRRMTDELDITRLDSINRVEPNPPAGLESSSAPVITQNKEETGSDQEAPTLMRRITGSLRRMTGTLGTSPLRAQQRPEGALDVAQPETDESSVDKPKRDTGPLGSLLTGILRGTTGEKRSATPSAADASDYVSEIRQDLTLDEIQHPKRTGLAGNIFQRITGSLRRATGSLGHNSGFDNSTAGGQFSGREHLQEIPVESVTLPMQEEIEELLLADRLAETNPSEQTAWAEPEDIIIELPPPASDVYYSDEVANSFISTEAAVPGNLDSKPGIVEPLAELGQEKNYKPDVGEDEALIESEPDWMLEIRKEAEDRESAARLAEDEEERGSSGSLRKLLTGIFQPEENQAQMPPVDVTDSLLTGRLGQDLEGETSQNETIYESGNREMPVSADAFTFTDSSQPFDEDLTFLERLQTSGFGQVEEPSMGEPFAAESSEEDLTQFIPYEPLEPPDNRAVFTISPEDEKLLWGSAPDESASGERTIRAIDWDPLRASLEDAEHSHVPETSPSEAYAATFLTGSDSLPPLGKYDENQVASEKENLQHLTEKLRQEHSQKPFEDIRAVLLADYKAVEQRAAGHEAVPHDLEAHPSRNAAEQLFGASQSERKLGLREWLQTRTALQKIILVEIILVILALLVITPLFFIQLFGKQNISPPAPQPSNLPYPVSVTLPGGWQFNLKKSTLTNGQWQPKQSEWLEGSELRRVIALPWNPQTEAVVQTFKPGDKVSLTLNNKDTIYYKFNRIERVNVDDSSIFSDRSPSLVIILYEEDSADRWVIVCTR